PSVNAAKHSSHWAGSCTACVYSKSAPVIGVPSDHCASGWITYSTTIGSSLVTSAETSSASFITTEVSGSVRNGCGYRGHCCWRWPVVSPAAESGFQSVIGLTAAMLMLPPASTCVVSSAPSAASGPSSSSGAHAAVASTVAAAMAAVARRVIVIDSSEY